MDMGRYASLAPKAGYWYRALRFKGEEKEPGPHRFAACAWPDEYGVSGTPTYIVSQANVIWEKDLGPGGTVDVFPDDPEAEGWSRVE